MMLNIFQHGVRMTYKVSEQSILQKQPTKPSVEPYLDIKGKGVWYKEPY